MDEKELEHMLEKGLSDFDFSLERRQAVLQTIRKKENPVVKRKASAVLVLAVVLSLLIGGAFFGKGKIPLRIFGMVVGAFVFRLVYTIALRFNLPAFMLKFVSSVIVILAISGPYLKKQLPYLKRRFGKERTHA